MKNTFLDHILIENCKIPLKVIIEWRRNTRIAINRNEVILRIPALSSKRTINKQLEHARNWVHTQVIKKPSLLDRFMIKEYMDGETYTIKGDQYVIKIINTNNDKIGVKLDNAYLTLMYPEASDPHLINPEIRKLLSRVFSKYYRNEVIDRIHTLNKKYINEDINSIRIKYNKSNWGSCSAKRNLNISSRLLFAPPEVRDYIYIHELTHLKELNHSPRFWNIVARIMPDYKEKERWLKKNGQMCDF